MLVFCKKLKEQQGFGLLEVLISLSIIIIGVLAGLSLAIQNTANRRLSDDRLIASNLAREPIEVIRQKRDTNWLSNDPNILWYSNIISPLSNYKLVADFNTVLNGTSTWTLTSTANSTTIDNCTSCKLYYHADTGSINSSSTNGILTPYKRLVTLSKICLLAVNPFYEIRDLGANCTQITDWIGYKVSSEVKWGSKNLILVDHLFNWQ
jgi:Tfp pilus assembly protein PilV